MRVLIVDDEPLARLGLRRLLEQQPGVEVIDECANGEEAVEVIAERAPDLVFLDVQMPGPSGFDVIEQLGADSMPPVVFVTAYDQYAVRVFEVHALDYLLKPIDPNRFQEAFTRASAPGSAGVESRLDALLQAGQRPDVPGARRIPLERLAVREEGRIVFVAVGEIDWIEAAGNYVKLHAGPKVHLLRQTMDRLEGRLGPERFLRIRRSLLVCGRAIAALEPYGKGSYAVVLRGGTRLISSRYYGSRLRAWLAAAS